MNSVELRKQLGPSLKELSTLDPRRSVGALSFDWGVIIASISVANQVSGLAVWLISAFIVAGRQHALLILTHDATHKRLFNQSWLNDAVAEWVTAYPLMMSMRAYRAHHLQHHQHLNSDRDPDWARKSTREEWRFPAPHRTVVSRFKPYLRGLGLRELVFLWTLLSGLQPRLFFRDRAARREVLGRAGYYLILITLVTMLGVWKPVLLGWFVPYFTFFPVAMKLRSIFEHFATAKTHDLNSTRSIGGQTALTRFAIAPHHVGLHLEHHLFPSVPFYRLPELRARLMSIPDYAREAHSNGGYFLGGSDSVWADLTGHPNSVYAKASAQVASRVDRSAS